MLKIIIIHFFIILISVFLVFSVNSIDFRIENIFAITMIKIYIANFSLLLFVFLIRLKQKNIYDTIEKNYYKISPFILLLNCMFIFFHL